MTNIELIKEISWVLSLASAKNKLDMPGEYVWAYPEDENFSELQARSRSIFSSGNAIKDATVIEYVQACNINKHLRDPWIVKTFEDNFVSWLTADWIHNLQNIEIYKYIAFSAGTQESFTNFYLKNRNKRFRVFRGEYWWHMDVWTALGLDWAYIEDDDIRTNDITICSVPFALTGKKHKRLDSILEQCLKKNCEVMLDFIYLPNMTSPIEIDLSHDAISEITFSFSKTFPVQCAKIAVRLTKHKPNDPMQISNDENICNRLSAGLAYDMIQKFPVDYMPRKYYNKQKFWCDKLGLDTSPVVHFATGKDYTEGQPPWFSKFNNQQGRYNLGMLFENEKLLKSLGYLS